MNFRLAALIAPLLLPLPAQALEKCIAADGSVSYVDLCPAGTTRAPSKTDEQLVPKYRRSRSSRSPASSRSSR